MLTAAKFIALEEKIRAKEGELRALKRKRAGFDNGHGWRFCPCGETNQSIGLAGEPCEPYPPCPSCIDYHAEQTVRAHDAGEHVVAHDDNCIGCRAKFDRRLPACAREMGCLCAGHARGARADEACNTMEVR